MIRIVYLLSVMFLIGTSSSFAEEKATDCPPNSTRPLTIGFIGSLSNFAASYGSEVLNGAKLAIEESKGGCRPVKLVVEDDRSDPKETVSAFNKLSSIDKIDVLIGGTWWANSIVKPAERKGIPLLSAETAWNKDVVKGSTYFILDGDLVDWVNVYDSIITERGWKNGAIIRFTSGFGETLEEGVTKLFSKAGRTFVGAIQYSDVADVDAASLVLRLSKLKADVVYIDAQPGVLAVLLKRLRETGLGKLPVLTNTIARDMCTQKLFNCSELQDLYFTSRAPLSGEFESKFNAQYGRAPMLESDLGYFAARLAVKASYEPNLLEAIRSASIPGFNVHFDERGVLDGLKYDVHHYSGGILK